MIPLTDCGSRSSGYWVPLKAGRDSSTPAPSQRGTVLNQTVIPLHQGTGTNPTIGVPQVRPALVLPQGTVQMAIPLQQGIGTNQTIGVGQVRPANAGAPMRPQGVIGKRF